MDLYPPFDGLMSADPLGWRRVESALWQHPNGLECVVLRAPKGRWHLRIGRAREFFLLKIPRTPAGPLRQDIGPLLTDITSWIEVTDHAPRHRLAHQIGGWLSLHGKADDYTASLSTPNALFNIIQPGTPTRGLDMLVAPSALVQALKPDLDALWRHQPSPDANVNSVDWMRGAPIPLRNRRIHLRLPTTQHGRMALLAGLSPEVRAIPLPAPATLGSLV